MVRKERGEVARKLRCGLSRSECCAVPPLWSREQRAGLGDLADDVVRRRLGVAVDRGDAYGTGHPHKRR